MNPQVVDQITGVPAFLMYFLIGIGLIAIFAAIYTRLTPHHEFALIRANNAAAASAFAGALLGFALPLHSAISHSVSLVDCLLWASIALVVQVLTFLGLRMFFPDLSTRISNNQIAFGVFTGAVSVTVGLINAASMSY